MAAAEATLDNATDAAALDAAMLAALLVFRAQSMVRLKGSSTPPLDSTSLSSYETFPPKISLSWVIVKPRVSGMTKKTNMLPRNIMTA